MADVHKPKIRSFNMSKIRSKDTKPEMAVRRFLHFKGYRYRLHVKDLPGKPDIVLPKYNTVILVQGCFWHAHENCKYFKLPSTRQDWWKKKIEKNKQRDTENIDLLKLKGWKVIVLWECDLKPKLREVALEKILKEIDGNSRN
ncbi:MAG: DNA mismatch endonuclease Vsr [Balneolales bacterium]|nr:DNA mismatch endonuclease Vsr [Balneolales bacterium]